MAEQADRDVPPSDGSFSSVFRLRRVILVSCAIILGAYHVVASAMMYPVPGGDAAVFLPAAINLKGGHGLTNSLWEAWPDSTGRHRYLDHPALFQMVVAACMRTAEIGSAFKVLASFNALTLALFAAFLSTAKFVRKLIASTPGFSVLLLSEFALAFLIFTDAGGRPETLSTLVLSLAIAAVIWLPRKWLQIYLGMTVGVAAAIHPAHGMLISCLVVLTLLLIDPLPAAIRNIIFAAGVSVPLFWVLLSLSPYPAQQVLDAVVTHAVLANEIDYPLSDLPAFYLKLAPWSGLYLLGLSLVLAWFGVYCWRSTPDRVTRFARLGALFLAALVFYLLSIRRPSARYYLSMLAPAVALGAVFLAGRDGTTIRRLGAISFSILTAFFGIFTLFLARDVALFVNYQTDGVSFSDAQQDFNNLARSTNQEISVSESLWVLASEFERIRIIEHGTVSGDLVVLQQTQRGSLSPPVIPGYRLISQRFVSHPPTWFGVPIARTMPGYSFAVFAREATLGESRPPFGEFTRSDPVVRLYNDAQRFPVHARSTALLDGVW